MYVSRNKHKGAIIIMRNISKGEANVLITLKKTNFINRTFHSAQCTVQIQISFIHTKNGSNKILPPWAKVKKDVKKQKKLGPQHTKWAPDLHPPLEQTKGSLLFKSNHPRVLPFLLQPKVEKTTSPSKLSLSAQNKSQRKKSFFLF